MLLGLGRARAAGLEIASDLGPFVRTMKDYGVAELPRHPMNGMQ